MIIKKWSNSLRLEKGIFKKIMLLFKSTDINLKKDNCRITYENIEKNLDIILKIVLNILKTYKYTTNLKELCRRLRENVYLIRNN